MSVRRTAALACSLMLGAATAIAVLPTVAGAAGAAQSHAYGQRAVCAAVPVGHARCLAHVVDFGTPQGRPVASATSPSGYSPTQIKTAYGFPGGGAGKTIAVVDAYGDATITTNLMTFSTQYGLTCTTCFRKVNQTGGTTSFPHTTWGWALEQSLDVEWAHALAPTATVLLVEANSSSFTNLLAAVHEAVTLGATYVSMSWGGGESRGEVAYDSSFSATKNSQTVSYFAASGDKGGSVIYPSASPNVVSVGGTTLRLKKTNKWTSETAWSTAGGGCSKYETANTAQKNYLATVPFTTCGSKRATPDVSLDANPSTGVAVYDTVRYQGAYGWFQVGGTSASTVMVAGRAADTLTAVNATYLYGGSATIYDVTSGSNGHACTTGYDLCTGLGAWNTAVGTGLGSSAGSTGALSFATAPQTLTAGTVSGPLYVKLTTTAPSNGLAVSLSTTSTGGGFSTTPTGSFTSALPITISGNSTTSTAFYFKDTTVGTAMLTASATGWTSGSVTLLIKSGTTSGTTQQALTVRVSVTTRATVQHGPWYHTPITVTVTSGVTVTPVTGATVTLSVYSGACFTGTPTVGTGRTGTSGAVAFTFKTRTTGKYCAVASAGKTGFSTGTSQETSFTVT